MDTKAYLCLHWQYDWVSYNAAQDVFNCYIIYRKFNVLLQHGVLSMQYSSQYFTQRACQSGPR